MNYRHIFHAGNFADVLKHTILIALLNELNQKEPPYCYLDTHAGLGIYQLDSEQAQKQEEFQSGVTLLMDDAVTTKPDLIQQYLEIIKSCNHQNQLQNYPGSPYIARKLLRNQDRMILSELHPDDIFELKHLFKNDTQVAVHHMDGYMSLNAFFPPKENRGIALIDPPFEMTNEFLKISESLKNALKKWPGGKYMLWYPIKNQQAVNAFHRSLSILTMPRILIHFKLKNIPDNTKLHACHILLLNPPWKLKEVLSKSLLPYLANIMNATWRIEV